MENLRQEGKHQEMAQVLVKATRGKADLTTEEVSYLAGVIDSGGCISIGKMKGKYNKTARIVNPRYVLTLTVTNTSEALMNWLVERFNGRIKPRKKVNPKHKTTWNWVLDHGKALHALRMIKPYLVVKKKQAEVGIELIEKWVSPNGGKGSQTPSKEVERRESLYQTMKILNQTGTCYPQRLNLPAPGGFPG